uniref:non-specific serine/threonine protein kinase n=1 Tax=Phallusia mammillata TaxID=59560 RepID=A0A6F9DFM7_9ASCI|nr:uncharacterized protein LOC100175892 [Phallusia mammillata]
MPTRKDVGEAELDLHPKPVDYDHAQKSGAKIRNLDAMLAQLCTLDRALDKQTAKKLAKSKKNSQSSDERKRKEKSSDKKERSQKHPKDEKSRESSRKKDSSRPSTRGGDRGAEEYPLSGERATQDKHISRRPQQKAKPVQGGSRNNSPKPPKVHKAAEFGSRRAEEILSRSDTNCCSSCLTGGESPCACGKPTSKPRSLNGSAGSGSRKAVFPAGGSLNSNASRGSTGFNTIEQNIREMAQAIGIYPEAPRVSDKIRHDVAYEEDVLRSKVGSISICDGSGDFSSFKNSPKQQNRTQSDKRKSPSYALKYEEINIKDADDKLDPASRVNLDSTLANSNGEENPLSGIQPRSGGGNEKPESNDIFGPKKTDRCLDRTACGDIEIFDEKTSVLPSEEAFSIAETPKRNTGSGERRKNSTSDQANEENCRVIVVRNPKLYSNSKKKKGQSSRKSKAEKVSGEVEGSKDTTKGKEKEARRKARSEKHKSHKHRKKLKDANAGNVDLTVPFENYIGGDSIGYKTKSDKVHKLEDQSRRDSKKSKETDEEKRRRRAERKMYEKRNKISSSDEGIARSPSKSKKHGDTTSSKHKKDNRRDPTAVDVSVIQGTRVQTATDASKKRDKERSSRSKDSSRRNGKGDNADSRAYSSRTLRKVEEITQRSKAKPPVEKTSEVTRTQKSASKPSIDRRPDPEGAYTPFNRGTRIPDIANWHANMYDAKTLVRPGRRDTRSKTSMPNEDKKVTNGRRERTRRVSSPTDVSTSSSYSSVSGSSRSSSSSYESSDDTSSIDEPRSDGRRTRATKYNSKHVKSRSPSRDSTLRQQDNKKVNGENGRHSKPQYRKSASSTSSFQRRPTTNDDKRRKNDKRGEGTSVVKRRGDENDQSHSHSPVDDKMLEQQFGAHRKRRTNTSVKAEGEDSHSLWQHHQLVVISQKPDSLPLGSKLKPDSPKANSTTKPQLSAQKKPVGNTTSGGIDRRSLTIRDLYSLHNVLSDTQNGTVISGYRRSDGLRVAIKRISKAGTTRWGWLGGKVVPLELALLCQVNEVRGHGIVEIVEWHETTEAFLLVMVRPHPAVDLYDYVSKRKRVNEPLARHIIRQLVTSLQHCIKCGVLHRDVKLENILLNPETMNMTLIDFGCGDYIRNGTYKEFAGTPEYYPPEWFARKQYHGEPLTVWSIGVLLYSLLCGSLPYRSSKEIIEKEATKFPSDISRGAKDIIASMLQKNPRDRPSLSNILLHAWLGKSDRPVKTSSST